MLHILMLSRPLTLITAIAPPPEVAVAHMVSSCLIITMVHAQGKCTKLEDTHKKGYFSRFWTVKSESSVFASAVILLKMISDFLPETRF